MRVKVLLSAILMALLSFCTYANSYGAFSYGKTIERRIDSSDSVTLNRFSFMMYRQIDAVKTDIGYGILSTFEGHDDAQVNVGPQVALLWRIKKYTLSAECALPYNIRCNDYGWSCDVTVTRMLFIDNLRVYGVIGVKDDRFHVDTLKDSTYYGGIGVLVKL